MRGKLSILGVVLMIVFCCAPLTTVNALTATPPALIFREVKITDNELLVLQANESIEHLNKYWLGYTSSDIDTPPPVQQLPDVPLGAGDAILLSDGGDVEICGVRYVTKLGPTLADTKGSLTLWGMQDDSFSRLPGKQATVVWSKSTKSSPIDMTKHDMDMLAEASLTNAAWYFDETLSGWLPANVSAGCHLTLPSSNGVGEMTVYTWPNTTTEPPAVIESIIEVASAETNTPAIPAADIGLLPPRITELFPNPVGTGNEDSDEFIELYNPNNAKFDLSGFVLQTGITTKHSYTFPAGTTIAPHSFKAVYSSESGLSLSNTGSQANLNDPLETIIAQTDPYASAKDGQSWALANGAWYWTVKPTPGASNVIAAPIVNATNGLKKATAKKTAVKKASVKAASTKKPVVATNSVVATANEATANPAVHKGVLAVVAIGAVGYVMYEYRQDLANAIHKLRRNRTNRS